MPYVATAVALAAVAYLWFRIFQKAGWSGWMGLLMVVPIVNLLMLLLLAFGRWPIHDRLEALENELRELREWR